MPISVNPTVPVIAAQSAAPDLVLQPGTVVNAQVLQILVRRSGADRDQPICRSTLLTQVPLQAGQTLQLAVSQTENGVGLDGGRAGRRAAAGERFRG